MILWTVTSSSSLSRVTYCMVGDALGVREAGAEDEAVGAEGLVGLGHGRHRTSCGARVKSRVRGSKTPNALTVWTEIPRAPRPASSLAANTHQRPLAGWRAGARRLLLQTDRLFGAGADRVGDLAAQRLVRSLLEDQQRVVVLQLEDLGGGRHAQAIALTQVPVNDDSHDGSPFRCSPQYLGVA
jgi:hypothetical protein